MNGIEIELWVKKQLKHTWPVFFSRHGRFFPIQAKTIPLVLQKKNVLVKSPTGSGKTEAVVAPLIENLIQENWKKLSILYVIPTRALANDTIKRLAPPLEQLGISIKRKTGDFAYEFKPASPSSVLVITPESLDSLLCRHPQVFSHLRAVVLDELHLLDNTVRGDQVRLLLERVRSLFKNPEKIQYCALSATFEKGEEEALRYFQPAMVITDEHKKFINAELFPHASPADWQKVMMRIRQQGYKKILVFCNSRADAEKIASELNIPPFKNRVYVHHGSLHKMERERVEQFMNERNAGLCVATMTLEFGIDIGDIDVVILYKPPHSITSFLQRIGRGCRRRTVSNVIGIYQDDWEAAQFESLITLANANEGDDSYYYPKYSVAIQQLLSLLRQKINRGMLMKGAKRVVQPLFPCQSNPLDLLISALKKKGLVETAQDAIYPTDKAHLLFESPQFHSNIGDFQDAGIEIRTIDDNEKIGAIAEQVMREGDSLLLSGQKWKIAYTDGNIAYVSGKGHASADVKRFSSHGFPVIPFKLAQAIKKIYYPDFPDNCMILLEGEALDSLYHFSGKLYGEILARIYRMKYNFQINDKDGIYFFMDKNVSFNPKINESDITQCVDKHYKSIAKLLQMGKFFSYLPASLQKENVFNSINHTFLLNFVNTLSITKSTP